MPIWSPEIKELGKLFEFFKGQLPELEKELGQLIHFDDPNVLLLYSRRCLEVIITDLCDCELKRERGTEPLKGIIDKFRKEGSIPLNIITSMDHVNSLSTFGTHPKDFDPEQVKPVLINLNIIIKWYLKFKGIKIQTQTEEQTQAGKEQAVEGTKDAIIEQQEKPVSLKINKLLTTGLIISILIIAAIVTYPRIFKNDTLEKLRTSGERISIAIMPFQNLTGDDSNNFWQEMIQDNLITLLSNSEELKVRQIESVMNLIVYDDPINYASITPSAASRISKKLDANVFIQGSINQTGSIIRLNAKLIDTETEEVFKSFQINGTAEDILQITDSLSVMVRNFLIISEFEKEIPEIYKLSKTTHSPEAYRYFIQGRNAYMKEDYLTSIDWFSKAIAIDSNFFQAMIFKSLAFYNQYEFETWFSSVYDKLYLYEEAKKWCLRVYGKIEQMPIHERINSQWLYATCFGTPYDRINYLKQLIELDDQLVTAYFNLGNCYYDLYQYKLAIPQYKKALEIYEKWDLKPYWSFYYTYLGQMYHKTGQYEKEEDVYRRAEKDFPDDIELTGWQGILALSQGDTIAANQYFEKFSNILGSMSFSEATITALLAFGYSEAGIQDKAELCYRQTYSLEPDNPDRVNSLSYFLIDKDRNIDEGMELIDKITELYPENFIYLHTKGWGLYKQGKYKEALDILQKSWDIRREKAIYNHEAFLHLEEAKKAVAGKEQEVTK